MATPAKDVPRPRITYFERVKISEKLDEGVATAVLSEKYGISATTVSRIRKKKAELRALGLSENLNVLKKRKSAKTASFPDVEYALYAWFNQKRQLEEPISGPMLCEKALIFNEKLGGPKKFKASLGWMDKFKQRHGIEHLGIKVDKLPPDTEAADNFKERFRKYLTENGYSLENVYNADETGWNWRSLPRKIPAAGNENEAPDQKINKDRVTVMFCSNATGTHKIPALVIGKYQNTKCVENADSLPVIYKSQSSAWMNRTIFLEWYTESFIPSVKKKQEHLDQREKVLLILDNAPSHPAIIDLNAVDKYFAVMYLPLNVTSVIQPMNQGVIEAARRIYKRSLIQRLLLSDHKSMVSFIKQLSLKDCCEMVATAWEEVSPSSLQKAWNNLIPLETPMEQDITDVTNESLLKTVNTIPDVNVSELEILEWLREDDENKTSEPLNDDEIMALVTSRNENSHQHENFQDDENSHQDKNVQDDKNSHQNENVQNDENFYDNQSFKGTEIKTEMQFEQVFLPDVAQDAIAGITAAYAWYETQPECTSSDLIVLNKILNLAQKKIMGW